MKDIIIRYSFFGECGILLSRDQGKISLRNVEIKEICTRETIGGNTVDYKPQVNVSFNCTEQNKFYSNESGKDTCVCELFTVIASDSNNSKTVIVQDVSLRTPNSGIGSYIQMI